MRIIIFGLSISSSWGNGHATIWRGLCAALARRRHKITFFERDTPYYSLHRDLRELPDQELVIYSDWNDAEPRVRAVLREADAGIVTSYCPDAIAACELVLASPRLIRTFYDLDAPVTLAVLRREGSVAYIPPYGLGDFDLVLSYTGGEALRGLAREFHARNVQPLYGSADPSVHRPVSISADYSSALSYLGTYAADRQEQLAELFLGPAYKFPELKFMLGGSLYPASFPWAANIFYRRHVPPHDHPAFYCSSRLTLNVTRRDMADSGYCPSGRLFEAAACGAPIISDTWRGFDSFFEPGSEILTADSCDDVAAALQMSERALRRIAMTARERVLTEHTADIRALQMERALESAFRAEPPHPES